MIYQIPRDTFGDLYNNYLFISGGNSGFLNNKVHQIPNADKAGKFYAMSSQFAEYGQVLNDNRKISYHLSGYGLSREEAFIRLIGEAIERYSIVHCGELLKRKFVCYSYNNLQSIDANVVALEYLNVTDGSYSEGAIEGDDLIGWFKCIDLFNRDPIYVPAQMFSLKYFPSFYSNITKEKKVFNAISTGTASHTSQKKALLNGLVEYLQIDSFMLFWYTDKFKAKRVILDDYMTSFLQKNRLMPEDAELIILDFTFDKPISVFGFFIIRDHYPILTFGVQGGADPYHTLYRGLLEALSIYRYNYVVPVLDQEVFKLAHDDKNKFLDLDSNVVYWASEKDIDRKLSYVYGKIEGTIPIESMKQDSYCDDTVMGKILDYCRYNNFHIATLDITAPELEYTDWSTVRVIIPELLPMCIPAIPFNNHPRMKVFGGGVHDYIPHPLP